MIYAVSAWSKEYAPLADLTWHRNKVPYAGKWGYETKHYIHPDSKSGDIAWNRAEIFLDVLNKINEGDYLFWTGADALVTNPSIGVEDFTKDGKDFYFSTDCFWHSVFADCFLLRSNDRTKAMLKSMLQGRQRKTRGNEQDAFVEYLYQGRLEDYNREIKHALKRSSKQIEASRLLSQSPVTIKILTPADNFVGDQLGDTPGGAITNPEDAWHIKCLIIHLGGKSLAHRLKFMPQFNPFGRS